MTLKQPPRWTWQTLQQAATDPNIGPDFIVEAMNACGGLRPTKLLELVKAAKDAAISATPMAGLTDKQYKTEGMGTIRGDVAVRLQAAVRNVEIT